MKRNEIKQIGYFLFNLIIILLLGLYLYHNQNIWHSLKRFPLKFFFILILIEVFFSLLNALINLKIIHTIDKKVTFLDTMLLQFSNNFLNKLFPKFGAGYRAYFLKKKYNFPYSKFIATIAGLYIISFLTYSLVGLITSWLIYLKHGLFNSIFFSGFLIISIFMILLIFLKPKIKNPKNKVLQSIKSMLEGWNLIKQDKKFIFVLVLLTLLMIVLAGLELKLVYAGLGYSVSLTRVVYLSSIGLFTTIANITPDGLGVSEALYGLNNQLIAVSVSALILGSLVLRGIRLLTALVFGGVSYLWLNRDLKKLKLKMTNFRLQAISYSNFFLINNIIQSKTSMPFIYFFVGFI